MAKLNLKKMSVEDVIEEVGIVIAKEQLLSVLNNMKAIKAYLDSENVTLTQLNPVEFIHDNKEQINKEKLIFCNAMNTKKYLQRNSLQIVSEEDREKYEEYKEDYKKCLKLLEGTNVEFPVIEEKYGMVSVKKFYTMNDLLESDTDSKQLKERNLKILRSIKKDSSVGAVLAILSQEDYRDFICYYTKNADVFDYICSANVKTRVKQFEQDYPDADEESKRDIEIAALLAQMDDFLETHVDKFDIEKLLLVAAYRAKYLIENDKNKDDVEILSKIIKIASENIENLKAKISGKMVMDTKGKEKYVQYSAKMLKQDAERIIEGKYYSKQDIVQLKNDILEGKRDMSLEVSREYLELLNFNFKEKKELIKLQPKNLEYLILLGKMKNEEIDEIFESENLEGLKINSIFIDYLFVNGKINKQQIVKLYMRNNIDLSKMLDIDEMHDLKSQITIEELMQYYDESKEDLEKEKAFNKYALLFRELKIKGKTPEQQSEMAEQIVEKLYETERDYSLDFKRLYKSDLLPIQTLIDWNGDQIIYDLILNQDLKPKDSKKLLVNGQLDIKKTYETLKKSNLSDTEKMNFIFSSFDGVGKTDEEIKIQNDARMYLIQAIHMSQDFGGFDENNFSRGIRGKNGTGIKRNQYITDPVYRWQLFSEIDDEATTEAYLDGTVIFSLPNVNNGTVVIEKLFKKTQKGNKINYGSATYIMSEEEFLNNKNQIEQDRKINRKKLIEMQEKGTADKMIHSAGWGKSLKKNLDLSVKNGYSEEKIDRIDELVSKIEQARELMD